MREDRFPCLFEFSSGRRLALDAGRGVTVGGGPADVVLERAADEQLLLRVQGEHGLWFVQPLGEKPSLAVNREPTRYPTRLQHLDLIQAGRHLLAFVEHDDPNMATRHAANRWLVGRLQEPHRDRLAVTAVLEHPGTETQVLEDLREPLELPGAIELRTGPMLIGRDAERADICLPDVRVSRVHASISRQGGAATLTDLKSTNGTFVDGQRLREPKLIHEGSEIQIGPYTLVFTGASLYPLSRDKEAQLVACDLVCRVPDRADPGRVKLILDGVSLVVRPREFVCILGPSGCGKSTLLSALTARRPADEGRVLLNGADLYAQFEALKQNLAVVPQRDALHDLLPLDTALRYTARLRLPSDMSRSEIEQRIAEMLASVHLSEHRRTRIRQLSGGQLKRASWVNEAICNPSLIFLDEVTSGLDEQADCSMMQLFRRMADEGKTIVCVTHRVGYVEQNCHSVVVLAAGGVLAFVGPPAEALEYFGIPRLGHVYERLQEQSPEEWKRQFRQSAQYERYVTRRLPQETPKRVDAPSQPAQDASRELRIAWRQLVLLARRYLAIQWADQRALAMMFGQSLLIAMLLIWLFGNISQPDAESEARHLAEVAAPGVAWSDLFPETHEEFRREAVQATGAALAAKLLFLLCVSCTWFGCNNAAKEIVKERTIYRRERDAGLKVVSYYGSKLVLLGVLSVLQSALLYVVVRHFTRLGGDAWHQYLLLALASLTGVALGLAISAIAGSEEVAVTLVPISLIPQIVMAGLIAPLAGYGRGFAQIAISAYWGYQGLLRSLESPVQQRLRDTHAMDLELEWGLDRVWTLDKIYGVLVAHVLVLALVAVLALRIQEGKKVE